MFHYDFDYISHNFDHTITFFYPFLWRSIVACTAINIPLVVLVMTITDAPFAWYLVSQLGGVLGLAAALKWVVSRAPKIRNKTSGFETELQLRVSEGSEQIISQHSLRLGFAIYWRAFVIAVVLYWPFHWALVSLIGLSPAIVDVAFGCLALYTAWFWWTLLSSPERRQVYFVVGN